MMAQQDEHSVFSSHSLILQELAESLDLNSICGQKPASYLNLGCQGALLYALEILLKSHLQSVGQSYHQEQIIDSRTILPPRANN